MTINEVAPPGFGHTKGDKEKGVKKGGTAAAFDKARKEGRFKGSKSDMFAIMWAMKNKGAKPKYKPGTDKKYKKYQDESVTYGYKGKKYKKLPAGVKTPSGWGTDGRGEFGKLKDAITDKLGKTNTKRDGVLAKEESEMPNVDKKDRGAIKKRFKGLFKKDLKGTVAGVNENVEVTGGFEFQDYDPNMKFREYEFIDIIKAEPLKRPVSEASGCSDDYEKLKKKVGSKKKHDKPAMTFKEFKDINKYT